MLKPAAPGTGVIAGGAVRAVVEAAGIRDILSKNYGSNNSINVVRAAMQGLQSLRTPDEQAAARGKPVEELVSRRQLEGSESSAGMAPSAVEYEADVSPYDAEQAVEESNDNASPA